MVATRTHRHRHHWKLRMWEAWLFLILLATVIWLTMAWACKSDDVSYGAAARKVTQIAGVFESVHDGDTVTLRDGANKIHKVRLAEIDAPELSQPWGVNAKEVLQSVLEGKSGWIVVRSKDRYGRELSLVYTPERQMSLNEFMVSSGWAWCYDAYSTDKRYEDMEQIARKHKEGMWYEPEPPWEYRKAVREKAEALRKEAAAK